MMSSTKHHHPIQGRPAFCSNKPERERDGISSVILEQDEETNQAEEDKAGDL